MIKSPMKTNASAASPAVEASAPPGRRHWLLQVVPPLAVLVMLLSLRSGVALVFFVGLIFFPALFSVFSLILKLCFFKRRKYYLLRPLLTLSVFALMLFVGRKSYELALADASEMAQHIRLSCRKEHICPAVPLAWQQDGRLVNKKAFGLWLAYPLHYQYEQEQFTIRVYQGPDSGHIITGGVVEAVHVSRYRET